MHVGAVGQAAIFHRIFRQASALSEAAPAMRRIMKNLQIRALILIASRVRIFSWSGACDASDYE